MHLLVIPGWYPNKNDWLTGDFIQRHMHTISLHCRVSVVFVAKDNMIKKRETKVVRQGQLTEHYLYYPSRSSFKWVAALRSFISYNMLVLKAAGSIHRQQKVDVVQLYVLQKNFFAGFVLSRLLGCPYVISEQSTAYVDGTFERLPRLHRRLFRFAFAQAAGFHCVSQMLRDSILQKLAPTCPAVVIPNVVDTRLFYPLQRAPNAVITFVHVSNMVPQKNVEGMLTAFAKVRDAGYNFRLHLVGPTPEHIAQLVNTLRLAAHVTLWYQRPYQEVAAIMQQSDVFVLFTRYETFGCVFIEAHACGLPVVTTDLPVTRELITPGKSGLLVQNENIASLTDAITQTLVHANNFDSATIAADTAARFSYENVSLKFVDWFRSFFV